MTSGSHFPRIAQRALPHLLVALGVAACIEASYWLLRLEPRVVVLLWPATGVAIAAFAHYGFRIWFSVALGHAWVFAHWPETPNFVLALIPLLYPLEAWAIAKLSFGLKRLPFSRSQPGHLGLPFWRFLIAPILVTLPLAFIMALACGKAGLMPADQIPLVATQILVCHVQGFIAFGFPLRALLNGEFRRPSPWTSIGPLAVSGIALVLMVMGFANLWTDSLATNVLIYLPFPFVVIAAGLLRPPAVSVFIMLWCLLSSALTAAGLGPFVGDSASINSLDLGVYNMVFTVTAYLISVASAKRTDLVNEMKMVLDQSGTALWEWDIDRGFSGMIGPAMQHPYFESLRNCAPMRGLEIISGSKESGSIENSWNFSIRPPGSPDLLYSCSGSVTGRRHDGLPTHAVGLVLDLRDVHRAEQARIALRQERALLRNIQTRLNPHFLFNALNAIRGTIHRSPEDASKAVTVLSRLLRANLHNTDHPLIPLKDEIRNARDLLHIASLRFSERFEPLIELPEGLEDFPVPPMTIYNLVENALKHGVEKSARRSLLEIRIRAEDNHLIADVVNSGALSPHPGKGEGLTSIRRRLELLYRDEASLSLTSPTPGTVRARLILPLPTPCAF